jgi:hypothetical protein
MQETHKCTALRRDGSPCSNLVHTSAGLCWAHDPQNQERRREIASKAAKARGNNELRDVRYQLKALADDVLAGNVDRGDAAVAAQVLGVFIRACEQTRKQREHEEFAERLQRIEEMQSRRNNIRPV